MKVIPKSYCAAQNKNSTTNFVYHRSQLQMLAENTPLHCSRIFRSSDTFLGFVENAKKIFKTLGKQLLCCGKDTTAFDPHCVAPWTPLQVGDDCPACFSQALFYVREVSTSGIHFFCSCTTGMPVETRSGAKQFAVGGFAPLWDPGDTAKSDGFEVQNAVTRY